MTGIVEEQLQSSLEPAADCVDMAFFVRFEGEPEGKTYLTFLDVDGVTGPWATDDTSGSEAASSELTTYIESLVDPIRGILQQLVSVGQI